MLAVGVGQARMAWSAAGWGRRLMLGADVLGSSVGIINNIASDDYISPALKQKINFACMFLQAPEGIRGLAEVFGFVKSAQQEAADLLQAERQNANRQLSQKGEQGLDEFGKKVGTVPADEIRKIDVVLNSGRTVTVELADDVAVAIGELSAEAKKFMRSIPKEEGIVNVLVHAEGDKVLITIDGTSHAVDLTEFASLLNKLELQGKKLRLLSCGSELSGKAISQQLNCQVIACEGEVKLYSNGKFESGNNNPWKLFTNGSEGAVIQNPTLNLPISDAFVTLSNLPRRINSFRNRYQATYANMMREFELLSDDVKGTFIDDFNNNAVALQTFETDRALIQTWDILKGKPVLRKDFGVLQAANQLRRNPNYATMGLTDDILGRIKTHQHATYQEIINDLDALGWFLTNNANTVLGNFAGRVSTLRGNSKTSTQGVHAVIKEIINNPNLYRGRTLNFEFRLGKVDGNSGRIDIYTNSVPPLMVECKWLTSSTVPTRDIVGEFIERDLFNAIDLDQIRWSIRGLAPTKDQLIAMLSSTEGRAALVNIDANHANQLLGVTNLRNSDKPAVAQAFIDYFNIQSNFNSIFR